MRKKAAKNTTDADLLAVMKLTTNLSLRRVLLLTLASNRGAVRQKQLPGVAKQEIGIDLKLNRESSTAVVHAKLSLTFFYDDKQSEGEGPAVLIEAVYELGYGFNKPIIETDEQEYAGAIQIVGITDVWPFWRELVHSLTPRMGLPAFPVPLLNPSKLPKIQIK